MQQRKYITVERSAHKQPPRASYQIPVPSYRQTYDTNFHGDINRYSTNPNPNAGKIRHDRQDPKMKYGDLHKSPSESNFKTRQQYVKGNILRRKGDGMVSNLKSQLQNLKLEVSKLMNKDKDKDTDSKSYSSRRIALRTEEDDIDSQNISLSGYSKDLSDSISVTSEKIIDEPLRRLESKFNSANYDHAHYMELENDLLKTELRNLKNKYNATKQDLRQKCQALEKKNEYLQISLRRSEQTLTQCKKSLQVEVQTIKFQLTRKLQQQYEEEQKRSQRLVQPVRDNLGENELIQEKISKLYEELSQKSKTLSTMNMELNEVRGNLQKKSFQLKKQLQKNNQLSKQLQFSKRQTARNKNLLQLELSKKSQQSKTIESLRQKLTELTKQLHLHSQIATSSEQLQNKYAQELKEYKENEEKLREENFQYQNQVKKLRQLCDVHQEEIKYLKRVGEEARLQAEQLMKSLKGERERAIQVEENYRKMLDEVKENNQKQMEILQKEFDLFRQQSFNHHSNPTHSQPTSTHPNPNPKSPPRPSPHPSKWKSQYKLLSLKFQQYIKSTKNTKEQIETYYKNYKQYKNKNKILEMRNKVLEESSTLYIEKIQKIQGEFLDEKVRKLEEVNRGRLEVEGLGRRVRYLEEELAEVRAIAENQIQRANKQESLRKQIQTKVLNLDVQNNEQLTQIIQKLKKRIIDQDEKINKYIKQLKTKDNLTKQLKKQIRTLLQNQQSQLQKFRIKEITEAVQQIQRASYATLEDLKMRSRKEIDVEVDSNRELLEENVRAKGEIGRLGDLVKGLKEEVRVITNLYNLKCADFQQILDRKQKQISSYITKLQQSQKSKTQSQKSLQLELLTKTDQIQSLRLQLKKYLSINKPTNSNEQQNFNEALKAQIQGSKKLREELNKKNQEVYRIRDAYAVVRTQLDNLKSQFDIGKLKFISDKKNLQVQFEVESQNLKTNLSLEQKKVQALQQKIKIVIDQNRKKDNFIQTYIMGKKLPTNERELVATFLKQYEICLNGKQLSEKLQTQSQELEKMAAYNYNLMKEIAELREKLLMYETVDQVEDGDDGVNGVEREEIGEDGVGENSMNLSTYEGIKNFD